MSASLRTVEDRTKTEKVTQPMQPVTGSENAAFDLDTLTNSDRAVVEGCAYEVWGFMRRTARDAVVVGRKLQAVKKILGHGRFIAWLRTEGALSADTAERLMKIAERFGDIPHNAEFTLTAFYTLIAADTPDSARKEAVKLAAKGEKITPTLAKAIKARHAAAAAPAPLSEEGQPNESRSGDTPAPEALTDPVEDRGSARSSAAGGASEPAVPSQNPCPSLSGAREQRDAGRGSIPPVSPGPASPDELVGAIDRLLAVMPVEGQPGWDRFVRKVRRLAAGERRMLTGRLRTLADAAVKVRRTL